MVTRAPERSPSPCHLIGIGLSTAVGGSTAVGLAAFRAGLTRTTRDEYGVPANEEAWSHVVRVGTLEVPRRDERAAALLAAAVSQVWPRAASAALRLGAWAVGPAAGSILAALLRMQTRDVQAAGEHGSAALFALAEARRALDEQRCDVAIVAGVALESDPAALEQGRARGSVLGGRSSFGTVPGEGAAALVLASERIQRQLGWPSLGKLLANARTEEATPFGGPVPCTGEALVSAVRQVLATLPDEQRADRVFCDLNGERERTDEWGFSIPRLNARLAEPSAFVTPVSAFGDLGSATGLFLLALASSTAARTESPAARCLIWTSSRGRERAAALFEARVGPTPEAPPPRGPEWARELDTSVLDELLDEAAFRYDQRSFEHSEASASTPEHVRQALLRIEGMLDQIALGLIECGELARERARAALEKPTPGVVYAVARLALEAGARELAELCAQHAMAQPKHGVALNAAISHAALAHAAVSDAAASRPTSSQKSSTAAQLQALVENWLSAEPRLAPFALRLAARSGVQLPAAKMVAVLDALPETAVAEAIAGLDGLTLLGNPETHACISHWQNSPHDAIRRAWAEAELVLGGRSGRSNVSLRAAQDPAIISSAALSFEAGAVPALGELAAALSGEEACWALGLLGDPRAVPRLLQRLLRPDSAHAAAAALEVLLGSAPLTTRPEPDLDERAPPRQVPCISVAPEAWQRLADEVLARHPQGARLRAGQLASPTATLDLLQRPHLPEPLRRKLALELSVRWKLPRTLDVRALLREQFRCISQLRSMPCSAEPGSWS